MCFGIKRAGSCIWLCWLCLGFGLPAAQGGDLFRVVTYNVEGYQEETTPGRFAKSSESKAKVRESLRVIQPDVLALQEMGSTDALLELRESLKTEGLDLPYWEFIAGAETNIHLAILSRFPFSARRPHTNDCYLLSGRRLRVGRGFCEVEVQVSPRYSFTLLAAHLKSKRAIPQADEAEMRLEEARLLREIIDARLAADPEANLIVLGDFNDTWASASTKAVIGKGKLKLIDTRPAERNGDNSPSGTSRESRNVTWTHYYPKDDTYSRIDFILLSRGMGREWKANASYVLALPNWGLASDHRPLVATFEAEDK